MKILTIIDNRVIKDDKWLWHYLPEDTRKKHTFDFIWIDSAKIRFRLFYYFSYFFLGLKALMKSSDYDAVVSWEAKCGIIFAFLQKLFRRKNHSIFY